MPAPTTSAPYELHVQREMIRLARRAGRIEAQRDHLVDTLKAMERAFERGWIDAARERGQVALQQIEEGIAAAAQEPKP